CCSRTSSVAPCGIVSPSRGFAASNAIPAQHRKNRPKSLHFFWFEKPGGRKRKVSQTFPEHHIRPASGIRQNSTNARPSQAQMESMCPAIYAAFGFQLDAAIVFQLHGERTQRDRGASQYILR